MHLEVGRSADRKLVDSQALAEQPVISLAYSDSGAAPGRSSEAFSTAGKTPEVAWYVASSGQFT